MVDSESGIYYYWNQAGEEISNSHQSETNL